MMPHLQYEKACVQYHAAKIDTPVFRVHGVRKNAASTTGDKEEIEPETDSTF